VAQGYGHLGLGAAGGGAVGEVGFIVGHDLIGGGGGQAHQAAPQARQELCAVHLSSPLSAWAVDSVWALWSSRAGVSAGAWATMTVSSSSPAIRASTARAKARHSPVWPSRARRPASVRR